MAMMPLRDTHYREAMGLFRRRCQLLAEPAAPRAALAQLDRRLAANLDAVACSGEGQPEASLRPPALFVETWVGLCRDSRRCLAMLDASYAEFSPEQQVAVRQAMRLCPDMAVSEVTQPGLQAILVDLQSGAALPKGPREQDDEWVAAWLAASDAAGEPLALFRRFYRDTGRPRGQRRALRAGLVRRDDEAMSVAKGLADDDVLTLLMAQCEASTDSLLAQAFTGSVAAAHSLLDAMEDLSRCEAAAAAWFWLTGTRVPRKPRLQAVGGADTPSRDTLPDCQAAKEQWQSWQWRDDTRYFFGRPLSAESLKSLSRQWVGQVALLVAAQRSWLAGRRVPLEPGLCLGPEGEADA